MKTLYGLLKAHAERPFDISRHKPVQLCEIQGVGNGYELIAVERILRVPLAQDSIDGGSVGAHPIVMIQTRIMYRPGSVASIYLLGCVGIALLQGRQFLHVLIQLLQLVLVILRDTITTIDHLVEHSIGGGQA